MSETLNLKHKTLKPFKHYLLRSIIYGVLIVLSVIFMLPFLWMVLTAVKGSEAIIAGSFLPKKIELENFKLVWKVLPLGTFFKNTCIITAICIFGQALSASLVAFGFARIPFIGKRILFLLLISTMMIPGQVTMIPTFALFNTIGWVNTFLPLTVPAFFGGSAFFIFLLRQFFMTIPKELDEAATIDGCTTFGIYWRILLPLSKPALTTVVVFSFIFNWNDFLYPLIFLQTQDKYTIAVGLQFFKDVYASKWNLLMAASVIALVPVLTVFFSAQKYFVEGIVTTGLKE